MQPVDAVTADEPVDVLIGATTDTGTMKVTGVDIIDVSEQLAGHGLRQAVGYDHIAMCFELERKRIEIREPCLRAGGDWVQVRKTSSQGMLNLHPILQSLNAFLHQLPADRFGFTIALAIVGSSADASGDVRYRRNLM